MALYYETLQSPISFPVNELKIENAIFDEVIVSTDIGLSDFPSELDKSTKLHAKFQNNIVAGGLAYDINKTDNNCGFLIKRREISEMLWTNIGYINNQDLNLEDDLLYGNYIDVTAFPNEDYEYMVVSMFNGEELESNKIDESIHCYTDGIAISEKDKTYYTQLEAKISGVTQNQSTTIIEPINGKYPFSFKRGGLNYITGSAQGLFAPSNNYCDYIFNNEDNKNIVWKYREEFREWLCNGKPKILKYYDGRTYLVSINDKPQDDDSEHNDKNITSFSFTQIGDVKSTNDLIESGLINDY